jgi:hypothetical protein
MFFLQEFDFILNTPLHIRFDEWPEPWEPQKGLPLAAERPSERERGYSNRLHPPVLRAQILVSKIKDYAANSPVPRHIADF